MDLRSDLAPIEGDSIEAPREFERQREVAAGSNVKVASSRGTSRLHRYASHATILAAGCEIARDNSSTSGEDRADLNRQAGVPVAAISGGGPRA